MAKKLPRYNFVRPIVTNDYLPPKTFSVPALAGFGALSEINAVWRARNSVGMTFSTSTGGASITDAVGWEFTLGDVDLDDSMTAGTWFAQVELTDDSNRKHTYFEVSLTVLTDQT